MLDVLCLNISSFLMTVLFLDTMNSAIWSFGINITYYYNIHYVVLFFHTRNKDDIDDL